MLGVNSGWIGMLGNCIVGRFRTCSRLVYITRFSRSFCRVDFYRPQRTCGKVMFLHLCVILFTRGSLSRGNGSLSGRPPCTVTCGRYASYWNAFLLLVDSLERETVGFTRRSVVAVVVVTSTLHHHSVNFPLFASQTFASLYKHDKT